MSKRKILFIEDDPDQIVVVKMRLETKGYEFVSAMDGEEGLNKVYDERPDLVLLDIILPKINGLGVCKHLKQDSSTKSIPVVIMTAAGEKDVAKKCYDAGADEIIRKPYESADLIAKIKTLIGE